MPATGREQAGVVLSKRGKVTARRGSGETRILKRGDPLYADETVYTVRGANAQLKMRDGNIVMLRGGSMFRMSLYRTQYAGTGTRFEYVGGVLRESRRDTVPAGLGITG
jgi:hypothetical protein